MNAFQHDQFADELARAPERALQQEFAKPISADSSLEDHADFHRKAAAAYFQRAADAKRESKEALARIAEKERAAKAVYEAERAICAQERSIIKADQAKRVSDALTLAAGAKANCAEIEKRL